MIRRLVFAATFALAVPSGVVAQDAPDLAARTQAAREAEETGRLMADVQQAAAVAQLQYSGMVQGQFGDGYLGAIALPGDALGVWDTVIVSRQGDGPDAPLVALAEYEISQGQILSETIHQPGEQPVLDGSASAMAQARLFAPRAVIAAGFTSFCAADGAGGPGVTFATIVLPPREDGSFQAYVLNGPIEPGAVPLGKHFRLNFDQFGLSGTPELVADTCELVTWQEPADAALASQVYVTQDTGAAAPDAVHAYLSTLMPMRLGVLTGDTIWPIAQGMIAPPVPAAQAAPAP